MRIVAACLRDDRVELERFGKLRCMGTRARTRFAGANVIAVGKRVARDPKLGTCGDELRVAIGVGVRIRGDIGGRRCAITLAAKLVA